MKEHLPTYVQLQDKRVPYFNDYMRFQGDGVWRKITSDRDYLLMEQKSLSESRNARYNWWNWNTRKAPNKKQRYHNMSGYRSLISHVLGIDPRDRSSSDERRVYGWMQVVAQLRDYILNLDHTRIHYRSAFAIPSVELTNFELSFARFTSCPILNPFRHDSDVEVTKWDPTLQYEDLKYEEVEVTIVEIECENYFSPIIDGC